MISRDKQVKIGAALSYLGVFIGIVSGLIYNPWMIRKIGNADYGLYTLAMSLINIFLVDFGLSMAAQRYISKYRAEKDQKAVDDTVGLIYKLYLAITAVLIVVFTVLYFFIDHIYVRLTVEELQKFRVLYIMVAIYSITSFPFITLNGILSSYEKFVPLKICELFYKIISISLTAIALFAGYGVYILVVVNLIAGLIVTAMRIIFVKRCTPVKANFAYRDLAKIKELFGFSVWTSISIVVMRLLLSLGPSILGIVSGTFEIAVFGYAVSIEGYVYSFVNAINGFFMPQLSRITTEETNKNERVVQLMVSVGKFILILFGLIFVGFAVMGRDFILLLLGRDYLKAYGCVLLICGYGIIAYPQQIANTYTVVQNKVKERAIVSLIAFSVYLLVVFPLGSFMGAMGIGIAVCFSLVVQTVLMNILYAKKLQLNVMFFFQNCHLRLLPGFLIFAAISVAISFVPLNGWLGFALKVLLIILVYFGIVCFLFFNKTERKRFFLALMRKKSTESNADHP